MHAVTLLQCFLCLGMYSGAKALLIPDHSWSKKPSSPSPTVNLDVYYETLCPDCIEFIVQQLYPTVGAVGDIVNVSLIPYGNAEETKVDGKWVFKCQHGPGECKANLIQTCAIHLLDPGPDAHAIRSNGVPPEIEFVHCMEAAKDPSAAGPECAKRQKLKYGPIESCTKGTEGNHLQHQMAKRTAAQKLNFVPWIVLDGVHNDEIQQRAVEDLIGLVCESYKGKRPDGCET